MAVALWSPTRCLAWLCMLTLAACSDPPADPMVLAPDLHRNGHDPHQTVVVDPNGRHDATTIQAGIDLAPSGGVVRVMPGTYAEALVIDKGLTLEGIGGGHDGDRGDHGGRGGLESRTVIVSPPGLPNATVRIATANPVVISDLSVLVRGQNGILAQGIFDLVLRRLNMVLEEVPPGASRLVRPENNSSQTGGRARLVVQESFFDANGLPATLAVSIAADIDAVIERNVFRRTGNSCIFVNGQSSEINIDIADNDLDECAMRGANSSAIEVGPIAGSTNQATVGVVNIVGNRIRNSGASCPPHTAIRYELHTGRIERNSISTVVQECSVPSPLALPAAIWVGSLRGYTPASPVVRFNDVQGNAHAGLRVGPNITTSLDARCNYWGSTDGPSGTGLAGTGDAIVVEAGAASPASTPFATEPVARRRHDGHRDHHNRGGHDREGCHLEFSLWSAPVNLGPIVNSAALETAPSLSPDGLSLYFTSVRPGGLGGNDIYISHRASLASPWEAPVNAGAPVNSPNADSHANFSRDGHLLFVTSDRPGGQVGPGGQPSSDIYVSHRTDTHDDFAWGPLVPLGPGVNTPDFEAASSYMAKAEAGPVNFYFTRGPDANNTDIYSAAITRDGETLGPATLVSISATDPVTSRDAHPTLRVDGLEVIFYATRPDFVGIDLLVSTRPNLHAPWSTPVSLGAPVNTAAFTEIHPTLSFDGRTLLWSSDRTGSLPGRDIWIATRARIGR